MMVAWLASWSNCARPWHKTLLAYGIGHQDLGGLWASEVWLCVVRL